MPPQLTVGAICGQRAEMQYEWKVENFFLLPETQLFYNSPVFYFLGRAFYLQLCPKNNNFQKSESYVGLFLVIGESCPPIEVRFTFGIKTVKGNTEQLGSFAYSFDKMDVGWGTLCVKRSELLLRRKELVPSNDLTLTATLMANAPEPDKGTAEVAVQTSVQDYVGRGRNDGSQPLEKSGCEKMARDLEKLWQCGESSDVIVKVKDVEFKAHRAILAARTPVLSAMFRHDTKERASGVITIDDCRPIIFEEFLRFIYTGSPRELTTKNAPALYALADKYLAEELKTRCLQFIRNNLSVETFCDAVVLARKHGEAELLAQVDRFAAENIRLIIKSVEWQKFNRKFPMEATEILIKALGPHEVGR